ncbi:hypothetical protein BX600DRAFT_439293 [Xylariales sp. PMI_506]|nr:hypothetical protein BX600DRAFT_439293 [Xylariales sp. PMI_506]
MPITGYGVWVATPLVFTSQRTGRSPHGSLVFSDGSTKYRQLSSAINVKSTGSDPDLVYWSSNDFQHPITERLQTLEPGFHSLTGSEQGPDGLALDLLRGNLLNISQGTILQTNVAGPHNDIVDDLTEIFSDAIDAKATVYLFGQQYSPTPDGIHDIHMNQGNTGRASWTRENGIYQDGSILLQYPDGHWVSVFIAFASQATETTSGGQPASGSKTFAQLLGQSSSTDANVTGHHQEYDDGDRQEGEDESHHGRRHEKHHDGYRYRRYEESPLSVHYASPGQARVTVRDEQKRDMSGWTVEDRNGKAHRLTSEEAKSISSGQPVDIQDFALHKAGGNVTLKDDKGNVVSQIVHSKFN